MKQLSTIVQTVVDAATSGGGKKWSKHVLLTLFFIVIIVVIVAVNTWHEPWVDEIEPWLIADNADLRTLLFSLPQYSGTPMLWHLLLVPFALLGLPLSSTTILNAFVVIGTVALLLWRAPFPVWMRMTLVANYYVLYEYSAFARSYSASALLLLIVAFVYQYRRTYPWMYAVALMLLSQTSAYGLLFAGVFVFVLGYELAAASRIQGWRVDARAVAPVLATAMVLLCTIILLVPATDIATHLALKTTVSASSVYYGFNVYPLVAFFPTVMPTLHYWNNSIIAALVHPAPVGIAFFAMLGILLWNKDRAASALWWLGATSFTVFSIVVYPPSQRHLGLLFFFCISLLWIQWDSLHLFAYKKKILTAVLVLCIVAQLVAAVIAIAQEKSYTFSSTRDTAAEVPADSATTTVIAYPAYLTIGVLPYLGDRYDSVYSLEQQRYINYIEWNSSMRVNVPAEDCQQLLDKALQSITSEHVVMVTTTLAPCTGREMYQELWSYPKETVVAHQQFSVYRLR